MILGENRMNQSLAPNDDSEVELGFSSSLNGKLVLFVNY
jgi:hypothetical protein